MPENEWPFILRENQSISQLISVSIEFFNIFVCVFLHLTSFPFPLSLFLPIGILMKEKKSINLCKSCAILMHNLWFLCFFFVLYFYLRVVFFFKSRNWHLNHKNYDALRHLVLQIDPKIKIYVENWHNGHNKKNYGITSSFFGVAIIIIQLAILIGRFLFHGICMSLCWFFLFSLNGHYNSFDVQMALVQNF